MISFYSRIQFSKFHFIAKRQEICLGKRSFSQSCCQFCVVSELVEEWGRQRTSSSSSADESTCLSPSFPLHLSLLSMAYALSNDVPLCKLCPSLQCCLHRFIVHVWRRFVIFSSHIIFRLKIDHKCSYNCFGGVITMPLAAWWHIQHIWLTGKHVE